MPEPRIPTPEELVVFDKRGQNLEEVHPDPIRKIGEPEEIASHYGHGITHRVQLWLAEGNGRTYLVAQDVGDHGGEISPEMTQGHYFAEVKSPDDPEALNRAISTVRKKISGQGFEE